MNERTTTLSFSCLCVMNSLSFENFGTYKQGLAYQGSRLENQ